MNALGNHSANPVFHVARQADTQAIAELFRLEPERLVDFVSCSEPELNEAKLKTGAQAFSGHVDQLICDNSTVAAVGECVVGAMVAFLSGPEGATKRFKQLDRLPIGFSEWPALRTLHIGAITVRSEYRRLGLGTKLISLAETEAYTMGLAATSIIALAQDLDLCHFLIANRYMSFAREKLPSHPLVKQSGEAILFAKYVA